ncbi:hypothetical protein E2320_009709 [Naja naja]|nr:hypothetical protein E2320_009709 [Naja naja]
MHISTELLFFAETRQSNFVRSVLKDFTMAAELDFSPPEIPEPTFMENILHYGLFFGAIFQLICVLAIILPVPKTYKMQDTENFETRSAEVVKKPKIAAISVNKKLKKETKKKR